MNILSSWFTCFAYIFNYNYNNKLIIGIETLC